MRKVFFQLLPKNLISFLFGKLAKIHWPAVINQFIIKSFATFYQINLEEAAKPVEAYCSLADFFIRDLKTGVRKIETGIISPVDGRIVEFGEVKEGRLLQVKSRTYQLRDLLVKEELVKDFSNAYFITIYLAPRDYHHIHSPVAGNISASLYIPGNLWPVNQWSVENIENLFCINERLITLIESDFGRVAVIKVGATNVGSISLSYDQWYTNNFSRVLGISKEIRYTKYPEQIPVKLADRIGTFNLGSTVILLFQSGIFSPGKFCVKGNIKLGQRLNRDE